MSLDMESLKRHAESVGIARLGVTSAEGPADYPRYLSWIDQGFAADMAYLSEARRRLIRKDPSLLLPGARSILVGIMNYKPKDPPSWDKGQAKIARYAWGQDYHRVMKQRLKQVVTELERQVPQGFLFRIFVDTGPLLERSLAAQAGVGWIGKNTCLINQDIGSYTYLGVILTTLDLPIDKPVPDRCGTCTRCLMACPTKAFVAPHVLDARRCLAYHTIENRALQLPEWIGENAQQWIAGCDICQEVCPWNRKSPSLDQAELEPGTHMKLSIAELKALSPIECQNTMAETALNRISPEQWQRNLLACAPKK